MGESKSKNPLLNGAAGFLAGCGSVVLTQPQDCVKSRMQGEAAKELYSGTIDCALKMMKNEGPTAFFAAQYQGCSRLELQVGLASCCFQLSASSWINLCEMARECQGSFETISRVCFVYCNSVPYFA